MFIEGAETLRTDLVMFVMCAVPGQSDRCEESKIWTEIRRSFLE